MSTEEIRIYKCKRKIIYNIATVKNKKTIGWQTLVRYPLWVQLMYHVIQLDHVCVSNVKASKINFRWSSPLSYNCMFDLHGHSCLYKTVSIIVIAVLGVNSLKIKLIKG